MKIDGHAKDMAPCQLPLKCAAKNSPRSLPLGRLQATPAPVSAMLRVPASSAAPGLGDTAWAACGGSAQHLWCTGQLSPLTCPHRVLLGCGPTVHVAPLGCVVFLLAWAVVPPNRGICHHLAPGQPLRAYPVSTRIWVFTMEMRTPAAPPLRRLLCAVCPLRVLRK